MKFFNRQSNEDDLIQTSKNNFDIDIDVDLEHTTDDKIEIFSPGDESTKQVYDDNKKGLDNSIEDGEGIRDEEVVTNSNASIFQTLGNITKDAYNIKKYKPIIALVLGIVVIGTAAIAMKDAFSSSSNETVSVEKKQETGFVDRENLPEEDNVFEITNPDVKELPGEQTPPPTESTTPKEEVPSEIPPIESLNDAELGGNDNEVLASNSNDELFDTTGSDISGETDGVIENQISQSQIGLFKGGFDDRSQYVTAMRTKESNLANQGINPYGKGGSNKYLGNSPKAIANNGKYGNSRNGNALVLGETHGKAVDSNKEPSIWSTNPDKDKNKGEVGVNANGQPINDKVITARNRELKANMGRITQGSVIPAILFNEINSDFPSSVLAYVREDVYDSIKGYKLLIPRGSKLIGDVLPLNASSGRAGVEKVITIWHKMILPNGDTIDLSEFRGVDLTGIDGLTGSVNRRILQKIGTGVFSGVFEGGISVIKALPDILLAYYAPSIKDKKTEAAEKATQEARNGVEKAGSSIQGTVGELASNVLTRPNTVTLKKGTRFNIVVNADIELESYRK